LQIKFILFKKYLGW